MAEHVKKPAAVELRNLSPQEREVYQLPGKGECAYEIAAALNISTRTVESYYGRILMKLGLKGIYELRHHAINYAHKAAP